MLWDQGTYDYAGEADDPVAALREGYRNGDFKFELRGKRLRGAWVLVRTRGTGCKGQWLLIKHRDRFADPELDPVERYQTSLVTGRAMEQIAAGAKPKKKERT